MAKAKTKTSRKAPAKKAVKKSARKGTARRKSPAKAAARPRRGPEDAISLLKADHRSVEALFARYEKTSAAAIKQRIAHEICQELIIHTLIEEEIFYPGVKPEIDANLIEEAYVEHDGAKVLIAELLAGNAADDFYDAKVKVLSEEIKHHVKEEEQRDGVFAQAKQAGVDLTALGMQMAERKDDYKRLFARNGLPLPETRTLKGLKLKVGRPVR